MRKVVQLLRTLPRARRGALVVAVVCAAMTALTVAWPALHFAYRGRELHVALETAAAVVALVAAFLVVGRVEQRRRLDDLLLALGLGVFALTNLGFLAVPAMFSPSSPGRFAVWAALAGQMVGAVAFAAAAFGPPRRVRPRHAGARTVVVGVALLGIATVIVALLGPRLPAGVETRLSPEESDRPRLIGHPAVLAAQLIITALFAVAAAGFVRRADREDDGFLAWLAAGSVLAGFARLHYFLYPSLYTEWVYSGDAFRILFYTTILVAAAREVRGYWEVAVDAAVLEERHRIARDLHDGIAQELAYVGRNLECLDAENEAVASARAGTERALAESRRAIAALTERVDRPLDAVLSEALHDVAARERTQLELALHSNVVVSPAERDALVRIACEAVTNGARHGGASLVRVELQPWDGHTLRLLIADTGSGFDPTGAHATSGGFGLMSMQARARAVGGQLRVVSAPGRGTSVEIEL
jgi:signal transduction histidine kinase